MKKTILLLLACMLAAMTFLVPCAGMASEYEEDPMLISLTHNCTNTGKMLPEYFDPNRSTYLLTVASWVSRVKLTPVANNPSYTVTVNGQYVAQGTESQILQMTDDPQEAIIRVTAPGGAYREYTVYLQRRPSERRTRVSAGYINSIKYEKDKWYIDADLVSVTYKKNQNVSTFTNKTKEHYKYVCAENVVLYYGNIEYPVRARDMGEFNSYCDPTAMYRIVYIEDEIVAVLPYSADY